MNRQEMEEFAIKLAPVLDGFTAEIADDRPVYLVRPDGACLVVHRVWKRPEHVKIIAGYLGGDAGYGLPRHEITVAVARGPERIAADIRRRLLPAYERDLAIVRERMTKTAVEDAQRARFLGRLRRLIPTGDVVEEGRRLVARWHVGTAGCVLTASGEASTCRIEIDGADHDLVARMARALTSE
ncbi:hypothetical protein [Microtetraspora sp. NBRC 16547]|uniref:hypothetical protein n=1 Tax=Microtetraspora sp. NBRC 16547 TaxID=3030993 RepID=UPI0024A43383|nr:hypothetical protein [Microtetraspora sp. NBRC 16547]GLW98255.1 hypothetical protein Misp02_23420 [Microtetraspora sp. NBRC 16547]